MRIRLVVAGLLAPAAIAAQEARPVQPPATITSSGPDAVEVSIYRGASDTENGQFYLDELEGFALISETRTITLPAGPATIRFEGVASGIEPASALVKGIGIDEKNQDANLLSQRGLLDHFTGQQVTIKRTDPKTGKVTEEAATIRSGSDRLLIQTAAGYEAVACTGLSQTLVFDRAPENLSAKPTLSVAVPDQPGGTYTITLTYLAANFDWRANYVAELNDDGTSVDILGWLTMASADATSFANARTNAVAGEVYREEDEDDENLYARGSQPIRYRCWPAGTTGRFQGYNYSKRRYALYAPPPPPPPPLSIASPVARSAAFEDEDDVVVVTATRIAEREALGDLKLYRIPFPTTLASNSQKQVAFLQKRGVKGEIIYEVIVEGEDDVDEITRIFRMQNEKRDGLGEPLPSGNFAFFQNALGQRQLVGEDDMRDKAVGEEVELELGGADNVTATTDYGEKYGKNWESYVLTISNANAHPVTVETEFDGYDRYEHKRFSKRTFKRGGLNIWRTIVPANSEAQLKYRAYRKDRE